MKKIILLFLSLIIMLSLAAGCGESESGKGTKISESTNPSTTISESTNSLANITVGDIFTFGSYEQDNDLLNGKEKIEWLVLEKEDDKALLISKYALEGQQFNSADSNTTWETCSLRKWMNESFFEEAFGATEQKQIITSTVIPDNNPEYATYPGEKTNDRVFLLSIEEANKYFKSDDYRKCAPTEFAKQHGTRVSDTYKAGNKGTCCWWLRTPGDYSFESKRIYIGGYVEYISDDSDKAVYIGQNGSIDYDGDSADNYRHGVRPAMWISLK